MPNDGAWIFQCDRYPRLQVRVEPDEHDKDGTLTKKGRIVQFNNGIFHTQDETVADALREIVDEDKAVKLIAWPGQVPIPEPVLPPPPKKRGRPRTVAA